MRTLFAAALTAFLIPVTAFGFSFKEGTNYTQLPAEFRKAPEPTLTKVYSVYCGPCYKWDKDITPVIKQKMAEKGIDFESVHIAYNGEYGDRVSQALAASQGTGKTDALKKAMFERIHDDRMGDWKSDKAFFATLAEVGFSEEEFKQRLQSPVVQHTFAKWENYEDNIPSTPSFVVNGKYLIKMDSLNSFDQFYALINHLLKQP